MWGFGREELGKEGEITCTMFLSSELSLISPATFLEDIAKEVVGGKK